MNEFLFCNIISKMIILPSSLTENFNPDWLRGVILGFSNPIGVKRHIKTWG